MKGEIPNFRHYMLDATSLNVAKMGLALVTRPNYLESLSKTLPGQHAERSVNGHVGKMVTMIMKMTSNMFK